MLGVTIQRLQIPRPPQLDSKSTPKSCAACNTGVPKANSPRRPLGVKTTAAVFFDTKLWGLSTASTTPAACPFSHGKRVSKTFDPSGAIRIATHHHIRA